MARRGSQKASIDAPGTIYSVLLPCISDVALTACLSIGSLKYAHHFGLDCFSVSGEHLILQASLTHSNNDELLVLSFACVLDASAPAAADLRGTGFVGAEICSIGATSLIGFSRSKFMLSAHPARARARSAANSHFIFAHWHAASGTQAPQYARAAGGKGMNLRGRLLSS